MARPRSDIAHRLVVAAGGRFLREGVDGASLRAIASDARTSIGMVYYYFPTKDDLFAAVVEETYRGLLVDIVAAFAPDVPPAQRLRRMYRRLAAMSEQESLTVRLILREVLVSSQRFRRLIDRFQRGHFPVVLAAIEEGMAAGAIRADLPAALVMIVAFAVGGVPQFAIGQARGRAPLGRLPAGEALADTLADVLFDGIGGSQARRGQPTAGVRPQRSVVPTPRRARSRR